MYTFKKLFVKFIKLYIGSQKIWHVRKLSNYAIHKKGQKNIIFFCKYHVVCRWFYKLSLSILPGEALEGSLGEAQMEQHFMNMLMDGLDILHEKRMFHEDFHLKNIITVTALDKEDDSPCGLNFGFRFIDFEEREFVVVMMYG